MDGYFGVAVLLGDYTPGTATLLIFCLTTGVWIAVGSVITLQDAIKSKGPRGPRIASGGAATVILLVLAYLVLRIYVLTYWLD